MHYVDRERPVPDEQVPQGQGTGKVEPAGQ